MIFGSNKTLEGILSSFTKTVSDLETFISSSHDAAAAKKIEMEQLSAEIANHNDEADRAKTIRDCILAVLA